MVAGLLENKDKMRKFKMEIKVKRTDEYLAHAGKKGMKWGFNDGSKNGKRTASDVIKDKLGVDERANRELAEETMRTTASHPEATQKEKDWRHGQYVKATNEYFKTPLGKIEKAAEHIESGSRYLKWLLSGKR